jgi:hypothetical protein
MGGFFKSKKMKNLYYLVIVLLTSINSLSAQDIFIHDFQTDLSAWSTSGDVTATWISQGANTSGAAQIEVLSTNGNINQTKIYTAYQTLPSGYEDKMLLVKIYAKSNAGNKLRIRAELHNNGAYRAVRTDFTLTDTFEKYILPVRIKSGDTDFRFTLQFGSATDIYTFDDISLTYTPYDITNVQLTEPPIHHNFDYNANAVVQTLATTTSSIQINIDTTQVVAPVLATQIGVNSNFRSGNSLVSRSGLYESFGAFRYPAGSGSDMYFWDGNIPSYTNGYSGTNSRFLDLNHFSQFLQAAGGQASVVANYAYARLGETTQGTREARVSQAAAYAAGFVNELNQNLSANAKYWEIGNECYGPWENGYDVNGSIVTGKEYGEDFRVFVDSMKIADPSIKIGATMSHNRFYWNKDVLKEIENKADYLIFHHYVSGIETAQGTKNALKSVEDDILELLLYAQEYTSKPFGYYPLHMTEYNSDGYHTTTMANGLFTTNMIATFIKNRVNLASIWVNEWYVNNDETHGIISKSDPNQDDYTPRPSYVPYYYFPKYFGNAMVQSEVTGDNDIIAYASKFPSGEIGVVVSNFGNTAKTFSLNLNGANDYDTAFWFEIYADNINQGNTKFYINGQTSSTTGGGPTDFDAVMPYRADYQQNNTFTAQPYSINFISIGKLPVPEILTQPENVSVCNGATADFSVQAQGQNLSYQWQKDGLDITGATNNTLQINNASTSDEAVYTCIINGDFGTIQTNQAQLQITTQTSISSQPNSISVNEGDTAVFTVVAEGSNLNYQWQKDNVNIQGATGNILTINNVQSSDSGNYQVVVNGDCGQITSQQASLNVLADISELENMGIAVYPNPSNGKFVIQIKQLIKESSYKLFDISGKQLQAKNIIDNKQIVDIQDLEKGVYILKLNIGARELFIKIIKK